MEISSPVPVRALAHGLGPDSIVGGGMGEGHTLFSVFAASIWEWTGLNRNERPGLRHTTPHCPGDRRGPAVDLEFAEDVVYVSGGGTWTDEHGVRNLLGGASFNQQAHNLDLPVGQVVCGFSRFL